MEPFGRLAEEDLELDGRAALPDQFGKGRRIGAEAADEVDDVPGGVVPVDVAERPAEFRRGFQQFGALDETALDAGFDVAFDDSLDCLDNQVGAIAVRDCSFGAGISKGIVVTGNPKGASPKKVTIESSGNTFAEKGGTVLNAAASLPTWTAR